MRSTVCSLVTRCELSFQCTLYLLYFIQFFWIFLYFCFMWFQRRLVDGFSLHVDLFIARLKRWNVFVLAACQCLVYESFRQSRDPSVPWISLTPIRHVDSQQPQCVTLSLYGNQRKTLIARCSTAGRRWQHGTWLSMVSQRDKVRTCRINPLSFVTPLTSSKRRPQTSCRRVKLI